MSYLESQPPAWPQVGCASGSGTIGCGLGIVFPETSRPLVTSPCAGNPGITSDAGITSITKGQTGCRGQVLQGGTGRMTKDWGLPMFFEFMSISWIEEWVPNEEIWILERISRFLFTVHALQGCIEIQLWSPQPLDLCCPTHQMSRSMTKVGGTRCDEHF